MPVRPVLHYTLLLPFTRIKEGNNVCNNSVQKILNYDQGDKNRRRGKNDDDDDKRELVFREDGQE